MVQINDDNSIYATRGDTWKIRLDIEADGWLWDLNEGDEFRFSVYEKGNASNVVMQKVFEYGSDGQVTGDEGEIISTTLTLEFDPEDTTFGDVTSKPVDFWYEIEHIMHHGMSPDEDDYESSTDVVTLIGYDEDGAKILKLFPEAIYEQ